MDAAFLYFNFLLCPRSVLVGARRERWLPCVVVGVDLAAYIREVSNFAIDFPVATVLLTAITVEGCRFS